MIGYSLILLAAVLWGLIGVLSQGVLDGGVSSLEIAFWRAVIGGSIFVAHAALTDRLRLRRRRDLGTFSLFGLVGVSLFFASYTFAIETGGISLAVILLYTAPAFVALGAWLMLDERLTWPKIAAVAAVLAGVTLVSLDRGAGITVSTTSVAWGLCAGLSYATYYIFGKRVLDDYHPLTIYAVALPVGALGLLPLVSFADKTPREWLLLGLLGVLSTYLAYFAYYAGLKRVEATKGSLIASFEPVVGAGLAALLYGERFGLSGLLGAAVILAASFVSASND